MSGKRRSFEPEFKLKCVLDVLSGRKTPAQICREHGAAVMLIEKNDCLGKKLLLTGNKRCNLTNNADMDTADLKRIKSDILPKDFVKGILNFLSYGFFEALFGEHLA